MSDLRETQATYHDIVQVEPTPRRILVVEDSRTQAEEIRLVLEAAGFAVEIATDGEQGFARIAASDFDLVISDIVMPGLSGYELCRRIKADPARGHMPVLLLTNLTDPLDILHGIECGADNYVTKPYKADALLSRIRYIFANQGRRRDTRLRVGIEVSFLGKRFTINPDTEQILDLLLAACEDVVRANSQLRASQAELASAKAQVERQNARLEEHVRERTAELARANAELQQEIEERKRAEATLGQEREFLQAVLENVQDGIVACDASGVLTFFNRAAREFHGQGAHPLPAREWARHYSLYRADGKSPMTQEEVPLLRALRGERFRDVEMVICPHGGRPRTLWVSGQAILGAGGETLGAVAVMHDVTERRRLEEQLRQAQKMEAIGQLAGGVAHDFNNLLTVINGYGEILLSGLRPDEPLHGLAGEIKKAGDRAAMLTRQLLAFSRKQVVAPVVLDLNAVIGELSNLLRRLISEDIGLATRLDPALGRVKADPGQVEQVLMNLAVNARDAMPQGGKLAIETRNVELDGSYAEGNPAIKPGPYVLLAVSDNGHGMTPEIKARIFEPFFTTKETGKGTGLGLATVYGIVQLFGGHIEVESAVDAGTTFRIFLPCIEEAARARKSVHDFKLAPHGAETVLLVEDEDAVRLLCRHVLQGCGYTVLEAADGDEAIQVCGQHQGRIHLLVTDVVMPGLGGRRLGERLLSLYPEMKVLYVSGYTDDAVVRHGVLEEQVHFLQKPFSPLILAHKIREVLDASAG